MNNMLSKMGLDAASSIGQLSNASFSRQHPPNLPSVASAPPSIAEEPELEVEAINHSQDSFSLAPSLNVPKQTGTSKVIDYLQNNAEKFTSNENKDAAVNGAEEVENLDPITRRQLKQDLLKGFEDPYDGSPERFRE